MSEYSVQGAIAAASARSLLDREISNSLKGSFSPLQSEVDQLVGHSMESAADGKTMFTLLGAGLAGNFIRLGTLSGPLKSWGLQGLSQIAGLAGESAVFAGLERVWTTGKEYSFARNFPKHWAQAAIQLGCLKGLGHMGRAENLLTQHLLIDAGMVAGHQMGYALGWTLKPRGNLAAQMLEAETTNLNMKASLALLHLGMPQLSVLEKSIQTTLQIQTSGKWEMPFPFQKVVPEGPSLENSLAGEKPLDVPWMAMSGRDGEGGPMKPSRWEPMLRAWTSGKRRFAAVELGREKAEGARASLEKRLVEDSSWEVRGAAAVALGKIGDFRSTLALVKAFTSDPRPEVREGAAYALGIAGNAAAVPELIRTFRKNLSSLALRYLEEERLKKWLRPREPKPHEEYEDYLTEAVAVALGRIGSPEAVQELGRSLLHPHFLANISALEGLSLAKNFSDRNEIEFWIEKTERKFSEEQAETDRALQKYMQELTLSPQEQRQLEEATARHSALLIGISILGRLKNPSSSPLLLHLLENADVDFKVEAAKALVEGGDSYSLSALGRGLTHPNVQIRVAALLALAKKGDPLARSLMHQIMDNPPDPETKPDFEARDLISTLRFDPSHGGPKLLPGHAAKGSRGFSDDRYEKMGIEVRD